MTSTNIIATNTVTLLVGDPVDDTGERRVLARLVRDLQAAGVDAIVFANFVTPGPLQRQVDLLIWTRQRVLQVEIKVLDKHLPVRGYVNGTWVQELPNGKVRSLGKNGFRQALNATYAVSDRLARIAPRGRKPAKDIDTLVCLYPEIPPGSTFDHFDYVRVVDYPALLARIARPATTQPWDRNVWDRLAMDLHVYDPSEDDDGHAERAELADYRQRAAARWSSDLQSRVDIGALLESEVVGENELEHRVRSGESVLLYGPSGYGKSFLARHLAVRMSVAGDVVVWLRPDEYERGQLRRLLAKGAAPFSSSPVMNLVRTADLTGARVAVVVDGLNECPADDQAEMLEQLGAFRLRYACGVVITSTIRHSLPDSLDAAAAELLPPDKAQRIAVLEAHGAATPHHVSGAFTTPHDLALAARCSAELGADATVAELHDAYIRTVAPTESIRAGLRRAAMFLHGGHRNSAPVLDVAAHLGARAGAGFPPTAVDDVLANPVLNTARGRLRFKHDLLRDFLVAEHLVLDAVAPADLADALRIPANRGLARQALALERDAARAVEVLNRLANRDLYVAGLTSELGPAVRERLRHTANILLKEAINATTPGCAVLSVVDGFHARWVMSRTWPDSAAQLLAAIGMVLDPDFLDLIGDLLDRTDDLIRAAFTTSSDAGVTVSHAVAAAYGLQQNVRSDSLPASFLVASCEWRPLALRQVPRTATATGLLALPSPGWGRCWIAAQTVHAETEGELLGDLVRHARRLGGYHLVLHALWAIHHSASALDHTQREAVLAALDGYHPRNLALSSTLVEALAALGAVEPLNSVDDIRDQIAAVLHAPNHPDAPAFAAGIISNQFEDESVVGPFCEAVDTLDPTERVRLILLATLDPGPCLTAGWRVRQLAHAVPTGDRDLDALVLARLRDLSRPLAADSFLPQEDVEVFLYAVEGLARLGADLAAVDSDITDDQMAWHQVGRLLLSLHRGDRRNSDWNLLLETIPASVPDVLWRIRTSQLSAELTGEKRAYDLIVDAYPDKVRRVLHWALEHPDALTSLWPRWPGDPNSAAVVMLGGVGDHSTVTQLEPLVTDQRLGRDAVDALRTINERLAAPLAAKR